MARRTVVEFVDDLDGGAATTTVRFAVDGQGYEIDLGDANAARLRDALAPYVAAGRRQAGPRRPTPGPDRRPAVDYDPKAVRAWAASNKIALPARGRIPATVLARYRAAGF